jgi:multidrug resistance efflux pump
MLEADETLKQLNTRKSPQRRKPMNKIASLRAAGELIKTASSVIVQQQQELEQLRGELDHRDRAQEAAQLAVRMADAGHIDRADLEEKAAEFAQDPNRMPVISEAINLLDNGDFSMASLSDEQSSGHSARSQLEAFLLGD